MAQFPPSCSSLRRKPNDQSIDLLRSIQMHGVCSTHLSIETAGDIETCLRARANRLRHMCIRSSVAGNMLSNTNNVRDWRLHAVLTHHLIHKAGNPYREDWRFLRICRGTPATSDGAGSRVSEPLTDFDSVGIAFASPLARQRSPRGPTPGPRLRRRRHPGLRPTGRWNPDTEGIVTALSTRPAGPSGVRRNRGRASLAPASIVETPPFSPNFRDKAK